MIAAVLRTQSLRSAWLLLCPVLVGAQPIPKAASTPTAPTAVQKPGPPSFTLTVTPQRVATLTATSAKASEIAQGLSNELKIPVRLSALVAKQRVTLKLNRVPIEQVLLRLAPQVYVDYEVRWDQPQEDWVGIELTGFNEPEPGTPVEQKAFLVFAGNTEDDEVTEETIAAEAANADAQKLEKEPPQEGPALDIVVKDGLVSIRARKQMVTAILLDVASKAGLGFETRGELDESIIDLNVSATPVEQIPAVVARPGVALLMRRNLTAGSSRPVAMLLGSEASRLKKPLK